MKAKITRKEAERYKPKWAEYGSGPVWNKGDHIAYNSGVYGWNWDLIKYNGEYYVAGYRSFPKIWGKYKESSNSGPFGMIKE